MKILKGLLLLVVVVILGGVIYTASIPSAFDVSNTKVINAPTSAVYNMVNELRTWEEWGSWYEKDTTIVVTYGDVTSGVGANNSWISHDGPGTMKIVAAVPNESIDIEMQFADYNPTQVYWTFEEVEGGTKVTWGMKSDDTPFVFKIGAALSGGWEGMFNPDQVQGLENMEKLIAKKMKEENSFRMDDVQSVDLDKKQFVGFFQQTSTDLTHEDMTKLFMESMPKVGAYAAQNGLKFGDYTPASIYTKWDEETKEAEFYIGLLLNKDLAPGKGMEKITVPAGKGVMIRKYGQYGTGDMEAHAKIAQYMEANKVEAQGLVWELYTNDPVDVKPQDIQTDIYYLLK